MSKIMRALLPVALGVSLVVAVPAAASANIDTCQSGQACTWDSRSYGGIYYTRIFGTVTNYANVSWNYHPLVNSNNKASSVAARGNSCRLRFWDGANHSGKFLNFSRPALGGTTQDPNLSNGGGEKSSPHFAEPFEDIISSHSWYSCVS